MSINPVLVSDGIQNIVANLGTERDKASHVTFTSNRYTDQELQEAFRGSWLARKVVTIPALDAFREWRAWQASNEQIEALEAEEKRLGLEIKYQQAYTIARLLGTGYVYFDVGDDQDKPVDMKKIKAGGIRFASVLSPMQLVPGEYDDDPLSPTFTQPLYYTVQGKKKGLVRIHPSRVAVFIGASLPVGGWEGQDRLGDSVLQSSLEDIKRYEATAANTASLVYESKVDVIKVKGLMEIAGDPYREAKLLARYALAAVAKGNNGTLLLDMETEEYEQKNATFNTLPDIMDRFGLNVSGAADIPATRLFGRAPAGMNATGESDLRNYYDRIASEQKVAITPVISVQDEMLIVSALGSRPPEIHYKWNSLWQLTDKERTDLGTANAGIIKTLYETGLVPEEVLAKVLIAMMTQAGAMPSLEGEFDTYFEAGGEHEFDEKDEEPPPVEGTAFTDGAPPRSLYVSRKVINAKAIHAWAKAAGIPNLVEPSDMHVTICYSSTPVDWMAMGQAWDETMKVGVGGPRLVVGLGADEQTIALEFSSSMLKWRNEEFQREGASYDWDEYRPHITLGRGTIPTGIKPYIGAIELGPEIFEEVRNDD